MIKKIIKLLLILLLVGFGLFKSKDLLPQIIKNYQAVKKEPPDESFFSDEKRYLKTFYLMKKGNNYYQAHYQAFKAVAGGEENIWKKDTWGWRLPFVFYLWQLLAKNGAGLVELFIVMSVFFLASSYLIAKKFIGKKMALLAPIMLIPYFLNAIQSTSFLFITRWAMFFFAFGLVFFYYHQYFLASLFFILAVISREHFIIPLTCMLLISIFYKKNKLLFLAPIISFFLMLFFHVNQVSSVIKLESPTAILERLSVSKQPLLTTLAFSTNSYLLVNLRPGLIWLIFSLLGFGYLFFKSKNKYLYLIGLASFLPLFLSLAFIGQSVWEDYWGAMYVPLLAIYSLTVLKIYDE